MNRVRSYMFLVVCLCAHMLRAEAFADSRDALNKARAALQARDGNTAYEILAPLSKSEPENAAVWRLLGLALHYRDELDKALEASRKSLALEPDSAPSMYNVARTWAKKGNSDEAFKWLEKVHQTGKFNLTEMSLDGDLKGLADDPRFEKLLPSPEEYADPFVETTKMVQEWKGEAEGDAFGWIARNIGDVDGDDVNDVTTSAPFKNVEGERAGRIYVYSGKSGKMLWQNSGRPGDLLGIGIEAAGDTNADGVPDVVAGAPGGGKTFVYSGKDGAVLLTLSEVHEKEGFGRKVTDIGDFDGDGCDDVLVGAPGNDKQGKDAGRASIYSGKSGSVLLTVHGEAAGDQFGSSAGGYIDDEHVILVVGAPDAGEGDRGRVYVYKGRDGKLAFTIDSDDEGADLGGMFVSVVGDVDGDSVLDVYASDWPHNAKGGSTGRVYVHSGATGKRLLTLTGETAGDGFGIGPGDAGDIDGDGHDDLIIGAWQHAGRAPSGGKVYLFSGRDGDLMRAWTSKVPGETFGFDATGMGDVDGDGTIDLLLTSAWSGIHGARSGRMFIISAK